MFPPVLYDGHNLFADFKGRGTWLRALDGFLRAQVLPNACTVAMENDDLALPEGHDTNTARAGAP